MFINISSIVSPHSSKPSHNTLLCRFLDQKIQSPWYTLFHAFMVTLRYIS